MRIELSDRRSEMRGLDAVVLSEGMRSVTDMRILEGTGRVVVRGLARDGSGERHCRSKVARRFDDWIRKRC